MNVGLIGTGMMDAPVASHLQVSGHHCGRHEFDRAHRNQVIFSPHQQAVRLSLSARSKCSLLWLRHLILCRLED
jgi:3-hydroxyisobutyrate dehydrogenase-like beta-hydroxyacid dehydrogenase